MNRPCTNSTSPTSAQPSTSSCSSLLSWLQSKATSLQGLSSRAPTLLLNTVDGAVLSGLRCRRRKTKSVPEQLRQGNDTFVYWECRSMYSVRQRMWMHYDMTVSVHLSVSGGGGSVCAPLSLHVTPTRVPSQVFSRLVLRLRGGEVILQEGLQVVEGVPLVGLSPPALQHEFMERGGAARGTGHSVAPLHLLQHLTVVHACKSFRKKREGHWLESTEHRRHTDTVVMISHQNSSIKLKK